MCDLNDIALYTFTISEEACNPTLEDAAKILDVLVSDIYKPYGVVNIEPDKNIYSVMAKESAVKASYSDSGKYFGPWSSPKIDIVE